MDGQEEYVRQVLEAYRKTPGTMGTVRRADRLLAAQLYQRGLSLKVIENALVLAATRRLIRPSEAPPLGTIRSLAYFLPVIEEVLEMRVSPDYFEYLRHKLARIAPAAVVRSTFGADDGKPTRTPAAWMILPAPVLPTYEHAFGVDDGRISPDHCPVPSPVPDLGHCNQALLGQSCQAPTHRGSAVSLPDAGIQNLPVIIQEVLHSHENVFQPEVLPVFALHTERKKLSQTLADDQVALVEILVGAGHGNPAAVGGTKVSSKSLYLRKMTRYCDARALLYRLSQPNSTMSFRALAASLVARGVTLGADDSRSRRRSAGNSKACSQTGAHYFAGR